ncbi:N-6 DNA methylase [Longimicrobium terrae]|uniref:Type I restriction-modification system DNA methylase subunit n=1 Tax=Longimicrobium terrae TaxID=1639882 RepID=A0A841GMJ5_9BACT|nr:N-6 DNA methylase [Longimicrobium terrae]MBB4635617.1 type I restriction-modification system DNA methylase subunit [Longimicrobium terrae]MBB6070011.1 type I restriction-modification system DNA methylase subunit [Longimicrobium terrae]NNC32921.1 N-6 DNA methylase [Longimicrobium terrae]
MGSTGKPDPGKRFRDTIHQLCAGKHQYWRVFSDWAEATALTLVAIVRRDHEIADRRAEILERYTEIERAGFQAMVECVMEALESDPGNDFLGQQFMQMELSNHWKGQFFTPPTVAIMMAQFALGSAEELRERVQRTHFVTVQDPAVGAGVMLIAAAAVVRAAGLDPRDHLHVTGVDVDPTAAHMAYIQLCLLGIPGRVIVGNSLGGDVTSIWPTVAHELGMWDLRLAARRLCSGE